MLIDKPPHVYIKLIYGLSLSLLGLLLLGCTPEKNKDEEMNNALEASLQFHCVFEKETLPPSDPEAQVWFNEARALEKADSPQRDYDRIGQLYRQAAARNHPKAMLNLANLISYGKVAPLAGKGPALEAWEIVKKMATLNISYGYYQMGSFLDTGYGVKVDRTLALRYFRQAADLGSPEGQYVIGDIFLSQRLNDRDNPAYRPDIGKAMLECAAQQGNGEAAYLLAEYTRDVDNSFVKALHYYQLSAKNGYRHAASSLVDVFSLNTTPTDVDYLAVTPDAERSRRYYAIVKEMDASRKTATFPDIDNIVPLPPAALPEWDGSFAYQQDVARQD